MQDVPLLQAQQHHHHDKRLVHALHDPDKIVEAHDLIDTNRKPLLRRVDGAGRRKVPDLIAVVSDRAVEFGHHQLVGDGIATDFVELKIEHVTDGPVCRVTNEAENISSTWLSDRRFIERKQI